MPYSWLKWAIPVCLIGTFTQFCSSQILDSSVEAESGNNIAQNTSLQRVSLGPASLPSIRAITRTTAKQLRADSQASSQTEQLKSALAMVDSLRDLQSDPRLSRSKSLQTVKKRLMVRLRQIQKQAEADVRKRKRKPQQIDIETKVLAQLNQGAGINAAAGPANPANGNANQDYGTLLANLIQRTISPSSWDVNGGLSSIQYWQPRRALIVRAPQTVHDNISPLLLQLRKQ